MTPAELVRLELIAHDKDWARFDDRVCVGAVIDRIKDILVRMKAAEREICLEILARYRFVVEYYDLNRKLLDQIIKSFPTVQGITFCPIVDMKKDPLSRPKSAEGIVYDFSAISARYNEKQFGFCGHPSSRDITKFNFPVVLVDDFVGSGDQALGNVEELRRSHNVPLLGIATLVIQDLGYAALTGEGISVISLDVRGRILPEVAKSLGADVKDVYSVYDRLEESIGVAKLYRRGWNRTEACITMKRTPNNTLPIFWYGKERGWPAPFLR